VTPLPGTQLADAKAYLARTTTSAVNSLIAIDLLTLSEFSRMCLSSNSHNMPPDPANMALTAQTQVQKAKEEKVVTFLIILKRCLSGRITSEALS
jgi:hypothetical protein